MCCVMFVRSVEPGLVCFSLFVIHSVRFEALPHSEHILAIFPCTFSSILLLRTPLSSFLQSTEGEVYSISFNFVPFTACFSSPFFHIFSVFFLLHPLFWVSLYLSHSLFRRFLSTSSFSCSLVLLLSAICFCFYPLAPSHRQLEQEMANCSNHSKIALK